MTRKRILLLGLVCALLISSAAAFTDLPETNWAYPYASYLVDVGVMDAPGDAFDADVPITRGAFIDNLWRALGGPMPYDMERATFEDVPMDAAYYTAVEWAAQAGASTGTGGARFEPDLYLTREMAFCFLYRAMRVEGLLEDSSDHGQLDAFHDVDDIDSWALDAMLSLYDMGIVSGTTDGYLMPLRDVTRAQTASLLFKLLESTDSGDTVG